MYGVIASQRRRTAAFALPVKLDFAAGSYTANGSNRPLATLLTGVESGDISAEGMAAWNSNTNRPLLATTLRNLIAANLAAGISFVFELDYDGAADDGPLLLLSDDADPDAASWQVQIEASSGQILLSDFDQLDTESAALASTGIVRYAVTIGRDDGTDGFTYEYAINGGLTGTLGTTTYDAGSNFASLARGDLMAVDPWAWAWSTAYMRKFEIYAAMSALDLLVASARGLTLSIENSASADAKVGLAYSGAVQAFGGVPPYSYSVLSGALPTGLSLHADTGAITGTPSGTGASSATIRATDDDGSTADVVVAITARNVLIAKTDEKSAGAGGASQSFSGVAFGTADAGRLILVLVTSTAADSATVSAMTIGGVSATEIRQSGESAGRGVAAYYAAVPTGETGTVAITFSSSITNACRITVASLYGVDASIPDSDETAPGSGTSRNLSIAAAVA